MTKSWYLIVRYRHKQKLCVFRERLSFNHLLYFFIELPLFEWSRIVEVKIERLDK